MPADIVISSVAQSELDESAIWYEKEQTGLGEEFVEVIYSCFHSICRNPEAYPKKRAERRAYVVDRFPFLIIYEYNSRINSIIITHVFHTSRNPKYKYREK